MNLKTRSLKIRKVSFFRIGYGLILAMFFTANLIVVYYGEKSAIKAQFPTVYAKTLVMQGNAGISLSETAVMPEKAIESPAPKQSFPTPMHKAIYEASQEFGVPEGLILGIAKAESSMGTDFAHPYDYNCSNWWGLRKVRDDGSYLRCFYDEVAGARTVAKLLANRYIAQGLDTPEKICPVWIGKTYAKQNCPHWIENVKSIYDPQ